MQKIKMHKFLQIPPNSAYKLASFHNSPNKITSIEQRINVTTRNNQLAAGANQLTLSSGIANIALGGALLHATSADGKRVGSFSDSSGTFVKFAGCGKNAQGHISGAIQHQGISATGTYSKLSFNLLENVTGQVTIQLRVLEFGNIIFKSIPVVAI